ncbi:MAG: type pilus assembly protein PilM [Gammaproteobacteria bacterium]|nr:type pilus assembly protein PilM [Gammaproteobacteria bacterium]
MRRMKNIWKKKRSPALLGITISNGSVKAIELTKKSGKFLVTSCAKSFYESENDFHHALQHVLDEIDGHGKQVAIALPDSLVMLQKISLDMALSEAEIFMCVQDEASKYFNVPAGELFLDVAILENSHKDVSSLLLNASSGTLAKDYQKQEVVWAAAKKEEVAARMQPFITLGLKISIVDVVSLTLQRVYSLEPTALNKTVGIAHFDGQALLFIILKNLESIYITVQPYIYPFDACKTLKQALTLFYASSQRDVPSVVFVSSDGFCLDDIQKDIQIQIANVELSSFKNLQEICTVKKYSPSEFLLNLGLAMRTND